MRPKQNPVPPAREPSCSRIRLAEGPVASVDACSCGTLHLQIGALTLRLAPEAVASILATLGEATAVYTARFGRCITHASADVRMLEVGKRRGSA